MRVLSDLSRLKEWLQYEGRAIAKVVRWVFGEFSEEAGTLARMATGR